MVKNQFHLLLTRRFLPLFITQFFGAFNDNLFKSALVILITYQLAEQLTVQPALLVTLTGCLLIIPMLLFSATAGSCADKFDKSVLIKIIKTIEIALMLIGAMGFIYQHVTLLMFVLFMLGMHSTFFGPLKYSILPAHLHVDELIAGNGLIEMGTFVAILLGNILGVLIITHANGFIFISFATILVALMGFGSSMFIPKAPAPAPELSLTINIVKETWNVVSFTRKQKDLFIFILGTSWFWLMGFVFLTEFPNYAKDIIGGDESVYVLFLSVFSIGVGIGSTLCNSLLKGQIKATYVPFAALGMTLFTVDLYFASISHMMTPHIMHILSLAQFLEGWNHWRITLDMFLIAVCGGIYIVPLYTLLQYRPAEAHKARVIGSNNIMNALFMVVGALITMALIHYQFNIPQIFLIFGLANFVVAVLLFKFIRHSSKEGINFP